MSHSASPVRDTERRPARARRTPVLYFNQPITDDSGNSDTEGSENEQKKLLSSSQSNGHEIGIFNRNGKVIVLLLPIKGTEHKLKNEERAAVKEGNVTKDSSLEGKSPIKSLQLNYAQASPTQKEEDAEQMKSSQFVKQMQFVNHLPSLLKPAESVKRKSSRILEKSDKVDEPPAKKTLTKKDPIKKEVMVKSPQLDSRRRPRNQGNQTFQQFIPFIEPPLAEPTITYTGLPLEAFPTPKIKKDSLWQNKGKKKVNSRESSSVPDPTTPKQKLSRSTPTPKITPSTTPRPEEIEEDITFVEEEEKCLKLLKTNEKLPQHSDIRQLLKLRLSKLPAGSKLSTDPPSLQRTMTPPILHRSVLDTRQAKKIKVASSPKKKSANTNLAPTVIHESVVKVNSGEDDPTKDNDEYCFSCGGMGIFLCCELCPKLFHFTCCVPPLEEAPEDEWFCRECTAKKEGTNSKWNNVGIFTKLLNANEPRNPKEFQLPKGLREGTFIGVSTGSNGEYEDHTFKATVSLKGAQIPGYNQNEDLEIDSLYDKEDKPYLCHKCGQSGLKHKTLAHCEYCPLVWHIDCIDEPMLAPKRLGTKWMCPTHIEKMIPDTYKFRKFKESEVVEPALHRHFLKVAQSNEFIIKNTGDSQNANTLQEYVNSQEAGLTVSTPSGVASNATKIVCGPNRDMDSFIYRIPEELILLDFTTKVQAEKKKHILETIGEYENRSRLEQNPSELQFVQNIDELKQEPRSGLNFNELVREATKRSGPIKGELQEGITELSAEEIQDLMNTKRLIKLKGREAMLRFLQS